MLWSSLSEINLPAVLVAGMVHMLTGLIWFRPMFFGNAWVELTGQQLKPAYQWIAAGIIGHQAIALALAIIINLAKATNITGGITASIMVWLGFVVTLEIGELIWEKIPFKLFMIRIGNHLVALSLAGIILAIWR